MMTSMTAITWCLRIRNWPCPMFGTRWGAFKTPPSCRGQPAALCVGPRPRVVNGLAAINEIWAQIVEPGMRRQRAGDLKEALRQAMAAAIDILKGRVARTWNLPQHPQPERDRGPWRGAPFSRNAGGRWRHRWRAPARKLLWPCFNDETESALY